MMNNIEEALSDYNTAIQLNPLNGGAFVSFYLTILLTQYLGKQSQCFMHQRGFSRCNER